MNTYCFQTEYQPFFSNRLNILYTQCQEDWILVCICIFYSGLTILKYWLHVKNSQLHREALSVNPRQRKICVLIGMSAALSFIHIVNVLFIMSNNTWILLTSFVSHTVGVVVSYSSQHKDHKHPLDELYTSLTTIKPGSEEEKKWAAIRLWLKDETLPLKEIKY
jgi:hypothetical protein